MAKKSNVNPDHYKTAGREPQGQDAVHKVQKQDFTEAKAQQKKRSAQKRKKPGSSARP